MNRFNGSKAIFYASLIFYAMITILPFIWAFSAFFKPLEEILIGGLSFIPKQATLDNYNQFFIEQPSFVR